jgi:hypothetical protein
MAEAHLSEEDLVMLFYRENGLHGEEFEAHLDACPSCRAAYERLSRVLRACDELPVPEPHLAFESRMWNRLEPQLHPLHRRPPFFAWRWPRWGMAAALPVLLISAFVAGRFSGPRTPAQQVVAITADGGKRVLLISLGDHLERSQMMLTEVANAPDASGISLERERARNLIAENRLYRQTTAEAGDPAMAGVLDELERVLLDISHGGDSREIKSRIDAESLIFKLRVLGARLSQTAAAPQMPKETL